MHEAAHAVVAVYLGLSFVRVIKVAVYETDESTGRTRILPPGLTNLSGPAREMRIAALAGCMANVVDGVEPWARHRLPEETTYDAVCRLIQKKYGEDLKTYHRNQSPPSEAIEHADLSLTEETVNLLMPKIIEIGEELDRSIQLSRRQVEIICNFNLPLLGFTEAGQSKPR